MYRCNRVLTLAFVLFPLLAVDARAELLLEVDGVELHGRAQRLLSGASMCNVLESDTSYEERKANHGAPMDVWRLDFEVRNRTGRWLDHLIARYRIASEWPACTNWNHPEGLDILVMVDWAGAIGTIQETGRNVVAPEARLTETRHLIVLQGDPPPRFSNWSVDFNLGAPGAAGPDAAAEEAALRLDRATRRQLQLGLQAAGFDPGGADGLFGRRTREAISQWQASRGVRASGYLTAAQVEALQGTGALPRPTPAASAEQETVFWQSIANSTNPADFEAYLRRFPNGVFSDLAQNRLAAIRGPAGSPAPDAGSRAGVIGGLASGSRVAGAAGSSGRAASGDVRQRVGTVSRPDQTCAGQPAGTACWMEISQRPGCYVWNPGLAQGATVTWTGDCVGGFGQGMGTLTWVWDGNRQTATGRLQNGRRNGHWVFRYPNGDVQEGPMADDVRNGHWILRYADGNVWEGPNVNGARNGRWVIRYVDGAVGEGLFVDDEPNGNWVIRSADGTVEERVFRNGERVQ